MVPKSNREPEASGPAFSVGVVTFEVFVEEGGEVPVVFVEFPEVFRPEQHTDRRLRGAGFVGEPSAVQDSVVAENVLLAVLVDQAPRFLLREPDRPGLYDVEVVVGGGALLQDHLVEGVIAQRDLTQKSSADVLRQPVESRGKG